MATSKQTLANLIAKTIADYNSVSITDLGTSLRIKSRTGTVVIPVRGSKQVSRVDNTHR